MRGHNNPPSPIETFTARADKYVADAASFAKITDANEALATDHFNLGTSLAGEIDTQRLAEKRPHLDANTLIDKTFSPVHSKVEAERVALRARLKAHVDAKRKAAEDEARAAAQRLRDAEEAARKAAETPAEDDPFLAATAEPAPDLDALAADVKIAELRTMAAPRVASASGGRTFSARKTPYAAEITDLPALAAHYASVKHPDLVECLQKLANAEARNTKGATKLVGIKVVGGD